MIAAFTVLAKGGLVMIPLALCSVLALAVAIERGLRWLRLGGSSEADKLLATAARGDWEEATRVGERSTSPSRASSPPVSRIPAAPPRSRCRRRSGRARQAQALPAVARYRDHAGAAPRLARHRHRDDQRVRDHVPGRLNQPTAITGGVGEALVATATGLAVAIAALVPYNFFQRRTEAMGETIERYGSRLELLLAEAPAARREAA
jgi:biopolymer transport protein ExbB